MKIDAIGAQGSVESEMNWWPIAGVASRFGNVAGSGARHAGWGVAVPIRSGPVLLVVVVDVHPINETGAIIIK